VSNHNKKANNRSIRRIIGEDGIGSNYKTIDTMPISFFHDDRVDVEMFPNGLGDTAVQITCPDLNYNSGLRSFGDEAQAELFARNQYSSLVGRLDSIVEAVILKLLDHTGRD